MSVRVAVINRESGGKVSRMRRVENPLWKNVRRSPAEAGGPGPYRFRLKRCAADSQYEAIESQTTCCAVPSGVPAFDRVWGAAFVLARCSMIGGTNGFSGIRALCLTQVADK